MRVSKGTTAFFDWASEGNRRAPASVRDVAPGSGARNTNLMRMLSKRFDHVDMGVYATVTAGGEIALGDALKPEG